jgi:hypothetical protein
VVTGTVHYEITADIEQQRRELGDLAFVPSGARVILRIHDDVRLIDLWALDELRLHEPRLQYDIHGIPSVVTCWVAKIRGGAR